MIRVGSHVVDLAKVSYIGPLVSFNKSMHVFGIVVDGVKVDIHLAKNSAGRTYKDFVLRFGSRMEPDNV